MGLLSDEEMENIHALGDCYVSFSSSEGVGMGAVEAALRNKPVIITRLWRCTRIYRNTIYDKVWSPIFGQR
jgi:hypothetical protein